MENRIIKFRIWDGEKMWSLDKGNHLMLSFFSEGIPWGLYDSATEQRYVTGDPGAILNSPGRLLQFTGLTNKEGVEIWEGDIIEFDLIDDDRKEYGVVRFSKEGFWTSQPEGYQEELLYDELTSKLNYRLAGNIYQNPEFVSTKEETNLN